MPIPAGLLNQSAVIGRSVGVVRDGRGGFRDAKPTMVGQVAVRVNPAGSRDMDVAEKLGGSVSHVIYALPGVAPADIRRGDQLHIGNRIYSVSHVLRPSVPDFYVKALALEVQAKGAPL